jgi:hypothetical protein
MADESAILPVKAFLPENLKLKTACAEKLQKKSISHLTKKATKASASTVSPLQSDKTALIAKEHTWVFCNHG